MASAQALRVLGALGAHIESSNRNAALLDDGHAGDAAAGTPVDVVIRDTTTTESPGSPNATTVHIDAVADDPGAAERRLQEEFGLAVLTGEPEGAATLVAGWPALLHCGVQATVAALLGLIQRDGAGTAPHFTVDARVATASMLDDALTRARRGMPARPRTGGAAQLERTGRLARAHDGWVSLSLSRDDEWQTLHGLARHAGVDGGTTPVATLTAAARAWIAMHTRRQVFDTLQAMRLACGMGLAPLEVLGDPLLVERDSVVDARVMSPLRCRLAAGASRAPAGRPRRATLPLLGLRVVELAQLWAGPAATALLAEWGATVIKVESPGRADGFRGDGGTRFDTFNGGKRSVLLNLGGDTGQTALRALLRGADVLVEAHAPRVLPNWGLDETALRQLNPELIVLHLPALGGDATAWPQYVAFGFDQEMLCGQAVQNAGGPVRPAGVPLGDPVTAAYAAAVALAAVWRRGHDGMVAHIELAQRDALLHQVAPRCEAVRRQNSWPGDALSGVETERARSVSDIAGDPVLRATSRTGIRGNDGAPPPTSRAPRLGEHTAAELAAVRSR